MWPCNLTLTNTVTGTETETETEPEDWVIPETVIRACHSRSRLKTQTVPKIYGFTTNYF